MCGFENEIVVKYDQTEIILKIKFTSYKHKHIFLKYWNVLHMAGVLWLYCYILCKTFDCYLNYMYTMYTSDTIFFKLTTPLNVEYLITIFDAFWKEMKTFEYY